jgi:YbbR domain-containing protein
MSTIGKIFQENLGIKIASVFLALLVFFYVKTQREGELTFKVSVELKGLPDSLTWVGDLPNQVSVSFSGKLRNLIRLRLSSVRIPVDLSQAGPGRFQRTLSAADVSLPEGSNVAVSHFLGPERINIQIEKRVSKAVRVIPLLVGSPLKGFALKAPAVAFPETVSVDGAASVVGSIDSLLTVPIDVSERRQSFSAKVKLDLENKAVVCDTQVVEVFVKVGAESLDVIEKLPKPIKST